MEIKKWAEKYENKSSHESESDSAIDLVKESPSQIV